MPMSLAGLEVLRRRAHGEAYLGLVNEDGQQYDQRDDDKPASL